MKDMTKKGKHLTGLIKLKGELQGVDNSLGKLFFEVLKNSSREILIGTTKGNYEILK